MALKWAASQTPSKDSALSQQPLRCLCTDACIVSLVLAACRESLYCLQNRMRIQATDVGQQELGHALCTNINPDNALALKVLASGYLWGL
jgi:hypothetical protein